MGGGGGVARDADDETLRKGCVYGGGGELVGVRDATLCMVSLTHLNLPYSFALVSLDLFTLRSPTHHGPHLHTP